MRNRLRYHVWYSTRQRIVTSALVAALLTGGTLIAVDQANDPEDRSCAAGVERPVGSDECVGVSSSGFEFAVPELKDVVQAIDRENDTLEKDSYATVALMLPFTSTDMGMRTKILHETQGAYLQQYRANRESNGEMPKIRLVLANTGRNNAHWEPVVERLDGMTDAPDRLRVVSGVATSSAPVKAAVAELTARKGIAVVGTTITADDIANGAKGKDPYPGLARVSPTNRDEARALAHFGKVRPDKALLVQDTVVGDYYTDTLKAAFAGLLKGAPYEPQLFTSPEDPTEEGTTPNTFRQITHLICDTSADTVYFAGRHTQLRQFINALGARGCRDRAFTVLTGDEGSYLGGDKKLNRAALSTRVTVRYAALAHPDAWADAAKAPKTGGSTEAYETFTDLLARAAKPGLGPIGATSLNDGQAIIAYDALALAVHGIRQAPGEGEELVPAPAEVAGQWARVKGSLRVEGASGWICLDNHGNPHNKAVPVVELARDGSQRFVEVAWPEGEPPSKTCLPPGGAGS
ncbi:ABC transporter substrate-binding protein [Streptomyces sp. A5-4]|uniref:ABC transporter substrate-binding protein n=1 Tax=Streptomyces sp. A5-4 TaxID=3384771 RepID=UPI003DA8B65A